MQSGYGDHIVSLNVANLPIVCTAKILESLVGRVRLRRVRVHVVQNGVRGSQGPRDRGTGDCLCKFHTPKTNQMHTCNFLNRLYETWRFGSTGERLRVSFAVRLLYRGSFHFERFQDSKNLVPLGIVTFRLKSFSILPEVLPGVFLPPYCLFIDPLCVQPGALQSTGNLHFCFCALLLYFWSRNPGFVRAQSIYGVKVYCNSRVSIPRCLIFSPHRQVLQECCCDAMISAQTSNM